MFRERWSRIKHILGDLIDLFRRPLFLFLLPDVDVAHRECANNCLEWPSHIIGKTTFAHLGQLLIHGGGWHRLWSEKKITGFIKQSLGPNHSDLQYSADIAEFLANFLRRIVKKMGQKLILGHNFISIMSDDFYVLQLCFYNIFLLDHQK